MYSNSELRFEVLTSVLMKIEVLLDFALRRPTNFSYLPADTV